MSSRITYASNKINTPRILIGSGPFKSLITGNVLSAAGDAYFTGNTFLTNITGNNIQGNSIRGNTISADRVVGNSSFFSVITATSAVILSGSIFGNTVFNKITATELTVLTSTVINFETTIFNFGTGGALSADEITAFSFVTAGAVYANNLLVDDWNLAYSIVQNNSANSWSYQGTDLKLLSGNWQDTYTAVLNNSANSWSYQGTDLKVLTAKYEGVATTVATNSSIWGGEALRALSGNWQDTWTVVRFNSGDSWGYRANDIKALTGKYENVSTVVQNNSAAWGGTILAALSSPWEYTTSLVRQNSATAWAYQGTDVKSLTSNYEDVRTVVTTNSSGWSRALSSDLWNDNYTTFRTTSANFFIQGGNSLNADLSVGTSNNRNFVLETNSVPRVYISSSGNVGIGTSSPGATLDINGSVTEVKATPSIVGNSLTLALNTANHFVVNLNSNITSINFSSVPGNPRVYSFILQFVADGTARTITWPLPVRWPNGIAPIPTSTPNKVDTYTFVTHDGGANYFGFISGQNS